MGRVVCQVKLAQWNKSIREAIKREEINMSLDHPSWMENDTAIVSTIFFYFDGFP